jgi:tetratricopeptide (TPR) repeat protein
MNPPESEPSTPLSSTGRTRCWLPGLLLVACTILAYQPAWKAGFVWDDDAYVTCNSLLTAPDGLKRIWFSLDSPSQYFPLTYTTLRLERSLWGLNPAGYHWINILLHAANALLVWRLLKRLNVPGAWIGAAIFALHPVNVESVAWITELKNVQSLFFFLLALLAWVEFVDFNVGQASRLSRPCGMPALLYLLALVFSVLALFSKTTACTLPAALLLVLWLKRQPINARRLVQVLPFVAMGLAMGLVALWWERHQQGTEARDFGLGFLDRILIASRAVWFYTGKLVWPVNLSFSYPRWTINPSDPLAYTWLLAGVALCAVILFARRFVGRSVEVAALFYALTLSPLLGFIMLYTFHYSFVADHYQYVAMIGPAALAAAGIGRLMKSEIRNPKSEIRNICSAPFGFRVSTVFCGALLIALAVLTWRQCGMYADAKTLWRTTLARNPQSFMAHNNLGEYLLHQGRADEAMRHFEETLRIKPDSAKARLNLGAALFQSGQAEAAIGHYREALRLMPDLAEAHKNLGDVYLQLGQPAEALAHSRKAVEMRPDFADAQNNLGNALLEMGEVDEAIAHLQKAVDLQPEHPNALNSLGVALIRKGRASEAMARFQKAVDIQPDFVEARNNVGKLLLQQGKARAAMTQFQVALESRPDDPDTLCNLAWLLATSSEASARNGARAIELAQRANEASGGRSPAALGTLAAAYAESGRFAEAVTTARRALELAEAQANFPLADMLRSQIELHQAGSPVRDRNGTNATVEPGTQ